MPRPGKTKFIKFPPSRAGEDVKCPGYARGGCISFDLTGTLYLAMEGIFPKTSPLWKCQLHVSFTHFFKCFGLTESPHPQENSDFFCERSMACCSLSTIILLCLSKECTQCCTPGCVIFFLTVSF